VRILITGATGFIGSHVAELALARGHELAALVLPEELGRLASGERLLVLPGTLAAPPWDGILGFAPEACLHAAWITTPGLYLESERNREHLAWGAALAERLARSGVSRILTLGTCAEYGPSGAPLHEDRSPVSPGSLYADCKNRLRLALQELAAREASCAIAWGRVFYPYGVGEHPARLCTSAARAFERDESLTLKTPDSVKDYIYVDDLAAAILTVLEQRFSGVVNLGAGRGVSVRAMVETIAELMGKDSQRLVKVAEEPGPADQVVADIGKLSGLGWRPAVSLEDGLGRLIASL